MFKMRMLSDFDGVRENNFTMLRIIFALSVLFGHAFPITGTGSDPISAALFLPHYWIGEIAVDGFFVISGFLVTASFIKRGPIEYAISRALRLYPAVIVYCLLSIVLIGPLAIAVPIEQYWAANPWNNMWNATLWHWNYNLPYAFADRTFPGSTNGATWSLPVEIRCYVVVLLAGVSRMFGTRTRSNVLLICSLVAVLFFYSHIPLFGDELRFANPLECFIIGSIFWTNRQHIPLVTVLAAISMVFPFFMAGNSFSFHIYAVCLSYTIFFIVYGAPWVNLDRLGDPSYGIYIYAWPIQQMIWYEGQSGYLNALISCAVVIPVAVASWFLIERPAIKLKRYLPECRVRLNAAAT